MAKRLIDKLERLVHLAPADRVALETLLGPVSYVSAGMDILKEGALAQQGAVLLDGMACRYKAMSDGRRQLIALLLPGDVVDLHGFVLRRQDHGVAALTPCRVAMVRRSDVDALLSRFPRIALALWRDGMQDAAILREWLLGIGQRSSRDRMAHFFCEMHYRLTQRDMVQGKGFALPLTQQQLGDTLGLSVIHIHRTLKILRDEGLMTFNHGRVRILELARLEKMAGFDPSYIDPPKMAQAQPLVRFGAGG